MLNQSDRPYFIKTNPKNPQSLPLFVFLPGMDGTGRLLHTQTATLEKAFDICCLAIPPNNLSSWSVLSQQVFELIRAERQKFPQRPIYLCGESFGGCLAMKVALLSPKLFDRIVLINPASSFNQKPFLSSATQLARFLPDFFFRLGNYGLLPLLTSLERVADRDRDALLSAMQSVPPKTVHWRLALLEEFRLDEASLKRLTQPILLLAGMADKLLPSVAEVGRLARIFSNAKPIYLPHSGHACLIETEIQLYQLLAQYNFLDTKSHGIETNKVGLRRSRSES